MSIFTEEDTEKCRVPRDLLIEIQIPDYDDRKGAKDALKREIYETLSAYTGRTLPWGTLSGIRPTKIPMKMLTDGASDDDILRYMRSYYLTSEKKAGLALDVAKREKRLLDDIPLGEDTYSIYLHVPFCPSICLYCTFSSSPADLWEKRMDEYLDAMIDEMRACRERLSAEGKAPGPTTVYIGGGTPTTLTPGRLERLMEAVHETWDMSAALEFTVEAGRPDSISEEKLAVLKKWGVTRISVNPQTMNDQTLEVIGRGHTAAETADAFRMARAAGFDNINMDIILGLPGEEMAEVAHTLREIERLHPDSLTVHSLAVKRASRLRKTIREDREIDAEADRGNFGGLVFENSETLMEAAAESARAMGMSPYYLYRQKNMKGNLENTGFSAPGRECLYNILIMEEVQSIYAFGAGASTKTVFPGGRIERTVSPKDVKTWLERRQSAAGGGAVSYF